MKYSTKIILIISGIFAFFGIVLLAVSISMGVTKNWDWAYSPNDHSVLGALYRAANGDYDYEYDYKYDYHDYDYESNEYAYAVTKNLDIELATGFFEMEYYDEDYISVEVYGKENLISVYTDDNYDTLTIEDKRAEGDLIWNYIKNEDDTTIVMYVPQGTVFEETEISVGAADVYIIDLITNELDLELGSGSITASSMKIASNAEIQIGAGNLDLYDLSAKDVSLDMGAGKAYVTGTLNGSNTIQCGTGKIDLDLENSESEFDYTVNCGIGKVDVNGKSFTGLGSTEKIDNNSANSLKLDCGVGKITVTTQR